MNERTAVDNIQHVIVLMFENRSFDHILGAMPGADGVVGGGYYNTMNPEEESGPSNPATSPFAIVPNSNPSPPTPTEAETIVHDFTHEYGDGNLQDLYGPGTTAVLKGQPVDNPKTTYPSTNSGFLSTIAYNVPGYPPNGPGALTYFNWGSMEVFHELAQSFVVCDAWHCDMPGHTAPNRGFMHCATTGDMGIDDNDAVSPMVNRLTIFERIQNTGQTWKMYWPGSNCDTNWLNEQVFSQQYNPDDPTQFNVTNVPIANFFSDVENNTLPFYSFIMCWNASDIDTSMHPASQVEPGETMLACIYNTLRESSYWTNSLLVVNFDENGGMYDHRTVPQTNPPDNGPPATWYSQYTNRTYEFDFSVLGARIPVLLISPWLNAGICSTQYQTTSILRFLQDMLPNANPADPYYLTQRDLNAPSIAPVFDYSQFGTPEPRTDCPTGITGYGGVNACQTYFSYITPDAEALAKRPAPELETMTKAYLSPLPGHPDSGKPITRNFATIGEMNAYAEERRQAALAYIRARRSAR